MTKRPFISVVSPVYKAEAIISELVKRVTSSLETITSKYEVILVCDGSPDESWEAIKLECSKNTKVVGLNLSRNFGQHRALTAGLNYARGEWVIVMDCDLQDTPEELPKLVAKAQEGYDIVRGQRLERQDSFLKKSSSRMYYSFFRWISGINLDATVGNYAVYSRKVIDVFNKLPEHDRDVTVLISMCGFKSISIPVKHCERLYGKSSYSIGKLLSLASDVIFSNSNKPLTISIYLGFCIAVVSLMLALYNILAHFMGLITVEGFTTTIFSVWFIGGLIMAQLGMLGIYLGRVFNQVKGRPLYIIQDIEDRTALQ